MTQVEKENGECSCHINPPCSFCVSLTEEEADAFSDGGMKALRKLWNDLAEKTEDQQ